MGTCLRSTLCLGSPLERFRVLASGRVWGRARGKRSSSKPLLTQELYGVVVSMTGKEIRITSTYGRGHRFWSYCIHIALIRYPPMVVKSRSQITFQCGLLWKALDGDGDINTSDSLRACMQQEGNRRGKSVRSLLSVVRRVCRAVASSAAC